MHEQIDLWEKGIAPSTELREWFHADPENRWDEFSQRYYRELKNSETFRLFKQQLLQHGVVTLLYDACDTI